MAKRKKEEPVYPAAPLVIPKDKFVKLLQEQISKGKELLEITVPLKLIMVHVFIQKKLSVN